MVNSNRSLPGMFSAAGIRRIVALAVTCAAVGLLQSLGYAQAPADSASVPNTGTSVKVDDVKPAVPKEGGKFPIKESQDRNVHLPPMLGFRGLAESKDIKNMLRGLITSEVSMMHQTMMMVENGAATGFIGGMQTVSNLMHNTVQTAQLELALKQITDPQGMETAAFANAVHKGMTKQGENQQAWPLGLFWASGDRLKEQLEEGQKSENFVKNDKGGSVIGDALAITGEGGEGSEESKEEIKLVDTLLEEGGDAKDPRSRQYAKDYIGDAEYKLEGRITGDPKAQLKTTFKKAEKNAEKKGAQGEGEDKLIRGFEFRRWEIQKEIWEAMYKLLDDYCQFKTENTNRGVPVFSKKPPASVVTKEKLDEASSAGIRMTINLIDQLFKVYVGVTSSGAQDPAKLKCDFQGKTADQTMPDEYKQQQGAVIQNCENDAKNCDRNKWLFIITQMIAEDRTISEFRTAHQAQINGALAQHPALLIKVQEYFCASLQEGGVLCDPVLTLEDRAERNRQRWVRKVTEFSEWAQNAGGAPNFTFKPQQIPNQTGGSGDLGAMDSGGGGNS